MRTVAYLVYAVALLTAAYVVFHRIVRRGCQERGRLTWPVSLLQLGVATGRPNPLSEC